MAGVEDSVHAMVDLKVAVVGAGGRGHLAVEAHQPGKGSRIVACCDVDEDVLEEQKSRYGADVLLTKDFNVLLSSDIDAIFICTPDFLHEEQALAVIRAGKACYLEKPLALSAEACDRILKATAEHRGKLYVGHNMRHMAFVIKMKEIIDAGTIGEVKTIWVRHFVGHGGDFYFKDWHAQRKHTNSLLLQKAAHDIDVCNFLADGAPTLVHGMGSLSVYNTVPDRSAEVNPNKASHAVQNAKLSNWPPLEQTGLQGTIDVEDLSMIHVRLDNGVLVSYSQCHYTPDYWRNYTVIGTKGRIENIGDAQPDAEVHVWTDRVSQRGPPTERHHVGTDPLGHGGSDALIVGSFLSYVRGEQLRGATAVDARNAVAATEAATISLRSGGIPVPVMPVDPTILSFFATKMEGQ